MKLHNSEPTVEIGAITLTQFMLYLSMLMYSIGKASVKN